MKTISFLEMVFWFLYGVVLVGLSGRLGVDNEKEGRKQ